jgi:hypothetical protein
MAAKQTIFTTITLQQKQNHKHHTPAYQSTPTRKRFLPISSTCNDIEAVYFWLSTQ